ncbi:hypothetical protein GCM10028791_22470 [Echinicola sediminis]
MKKGHLLSFKKFERGTFKLASKLEKISLMTTMLLGSATYLFDSLSQQKEFEAVVHKPNGPTSTTFLVEFKYKDGSIFIFREMIYGNLLSNPLAAENPKNYGLLFGFNLKRNDQYNIILTALKAYWKENDIMYTEHYAEIPDLSQGS